MFKTRLLSGIVLVLVALLTICSGGTVLYMTVLCLSLIGAGELFRVMKVREDKWNLLEITGYAGVVIFYLSLLLHDPMYQMLALQYGEDRGTLKEDWLRFPHRLSLIHI